MDTKKFFEENYKDYISTYIKNSLDFELKRPRIEFLLKVTSCFDDYDKLEKVIQAFNIHDIRFNFEKVCSEITNNILSSYNNILNAINIRTGSSEFSKALLDQSFILSERERLLAILKKDFNLYLIKLDKLDRILCNIKNTFPQFKKANKKSEDVLSIGTSVALIFISPAASLLNSFRTITKCGRDSQIMETFQNNFKELYACIGDRSYDSILEQNINTLTVYINNSIVKTLANIALRNLTTQDKISKAQECVENCLKSYKMMGSTKLEILDYLISLADIDKKCYFIDNDIYLGEVLDDKKNGNGIYWWPSGSAYYGRWRNGKKNGHAINVLDDGSTIIGEYVNGYLEHYGTYIWKSGTIYTGYFNRDCLHGSGTMIWDTGEYCKGKWENDKRTENSSYFFLPENVHSFV